MTFRPLSFLSTSLFSFVLIFGLTHTSQAAAVSAGSLVKASSPAVYYVSENNTRYAFPDQATYATWYSDFSRVQTISDADLAALPLGGVVTVRPGSRMVKIQTDPRVYVVSRGGYLHWLPTETLARSLYGDTWNRQVNDVPDAFFTNYRMGADLTAGSLFSPTEEQSIISSIDADIRARLTVSLPTPAPSTPTSTSSTGSTSPSTPTSTTPSPVLSGRIDILSNPTPTGGDIMTVLASVTSGYADHITLSASSNPSPTICTRTPCRGEFTFSPSQSTSTYALMAVFQLGQGTNAVYSTSTIEVTVLPNSASSAVVLTAPIQVIRNNNRTLSAEVNDTFYAHSIQLFLDDNLIKECTRVQRCEVTDEETSPGGTTHRFYAILRNEQGQRLFSRVASFPVVQ